MVSLGVLAGSMTCSDSWPAQAVGEATGARICAKVDGPVILPAVPPTSSCGHMQSSPSCPEQAWQRSVHATVSNGARPCTCSPAGTHVCRQGPNSGGAGWTPSSCRAASGSFCPATHSRQACHAVLHAQGVLQHQCLSNRAYTATTPHASWQWQVLAPTMQHMHTDSTSAASFQTPC